MTDQRASNAPINNSLRSLPQWGRVCGIGILAVLASVPDTKAQEPTSRLKFPSLFRKAEPAPTQPQVTPAARRESDNNRVLARARQLMAEARTQEAGGRIDLALDLASRAEGVYQAAQRTLDARWPANEQSPAEYVRVLEKRLLASAASGADARVDLDADDRELPVARTLSANQITKPMTPSRSLAKPAARTSAASDFEELKSDFGKTQRPAAARELPEPEEPATEVAANNLRPASNTLLDWAQRGRQALQTIEAVKDVAEVVTGEPLLPDPELPDSPSGAEVAAAEPTKVERSLNAAKSVLDRLDHLNSWQPASAEKPAKGESPQSIEQGEPPLPDVSQRGAATVRGPLEIPDLINSPSGISDRQVGPIPTSIDWKHDGRSNGLEIGAPAKLDGSGVSRAVRPNDDIDPHGAALLLPQVGAAKADSTEVASVVPRSLWVVGTVQTIATFFGVLGAIATVLLVKSVQKKSQAVPATAKAAKTATAMNPVTQPVTATAAADVKPTVTATSTTAVPTSSTNSATVPFRVVGANSMKAKATTTASSESESPLRSVFDQNVELLESLNNLPKQKAA